jgi:hypothetical protein
MTTNRRGSEIQLVITTAKNTADVDVLCIFGCELDCGDSDGDVLSVRKVAVLLKDGVITRATDGQG